MRFQKYIFHFKFSSFFLPHTSTQNHFYIWRKFMHNIANQTEKICKLLISCPFIKAEPRTSTFVINAKQKSSIRSQIFSNLNNFFFSQSRIHSKSKNNILSSLTNFFQTKWFTISQTFFSTTIWKIIFIRIIPSPSRSCLFMNNTCTSRPTFIIRVISIHQTNTAVNFSHLLQDIILIYIKTAFASIPHI